MALSKKEKQAYGFFGLYKRAKNAGNNAQMASAREGLKTLGYKVQGDGIVKIEAAAKKPAEKKPAAKKPAAKKTETKTEAAPAEAPAKKAPAKKKAAAKKPAAKKAAAKKPAAKKAAAKGGRKPKSRKGPAFPAAPKGGKVLSKSATTTSKKNGRVVTRTVTRTFRENPMGEVGTMLLLLLFGTIGAIGSDMLDRWIAIMPEKAEGQTGDQPLLSGVAAASAILKRPDGKRMAAQGALVLLLGALAWYLNKKNKRIPSIIVGALALGAGIRSALQIANGYAMPAAFKSSGDASKPSFGDHMYSAEQAAAQADLDNALKGYLNGELGAPEAPAAPAAPAGKTLAGIAERVGAPAPPSAQVSDRRPAALQPPAQVAHELTRPVAPAARVGAPQNAPALTQGALAREVDKKDGKLGCGGPSCGPTCGCDACKAAFGNNPFGALFNQRPPVSPPALPPRQGATPIPTPASNAIGNVVSFVPRASRPTVARALPHLAAR